MYVCIYIMCIYADIDTYNIRALWRWWHTCKHTRNANSWACVFECNFTCLWVDAYRCVYIEEMETQTQKHTVCSFACLCVDAYECAYIEDGDTDTQTYSRDNFSHKYSRVCPNMRVPKYAFAYKHNLWTNKMHRMRTRTHSLHMLHMLRELIHTHTSHERTPTHICSFACMQHEFVRAAQIMNKELTPGHNLVKACLQDGRHLRRSVRKSRSTIPPGRFHACSSDKRTQGTLV